MNVVFFDAETRSESDLPLAGARNYAEHPSTSIMCAVWVWDQQGVIWVPSPPRRFSDDVEDYLVEHFNARAISWAIHTGASHPHIPTGRPWVAHNGDMFDRRVWEAKGLPTPVSWIDSLKLSRRASLPASLDGLSSVLFDIGKHAGSTALQALCKPDKRTGRFLPLNHKNIRPLVAYCVQDVLMMREAYNVALIHHVEDVDDDVLRIDQDINDRGVGFDVDLAKLLIDVEHDVREKRGDTLAALTGGVVTREMLRSSAKITKLFYERYGVALPNTQKDTLLEILEDELYGGPEFKEMRMVIEARIGENGISAAKLIRGLNAARETEYGHVLHDLYAYHAADTGRWGGRVIQPQNFPRGSLKPLAYSDALNTLIAESKAPTMPRMDLVSLLAELADDNNVSTSDLLSSLTRSTLIPSRGFAYLASADYRAVEARVLLWLAGDEEGLDDYRKGVDRYKKMASALFDVPYDDVTKEQRQIAKIPVLGGGYGMGGEGMANFAKQMGVDFEALGIDAQQVVDTFRDQNWKVAGARTGDLYEGHVCREGGLWKAYHKAAMDTIHTGQGRFVYKVSFFMRGPHLTLRLPSGKLLTYRHATIEDVENPWGGTSRTWVYTRSFFKNVVRVAQTKGKITENICQAIATGCGGFTGYSMVQVANAGFNIVMHTHDDVTVEVNNESEAHRFAEVFAQTPPWAIGFPMAVEGHMGRRLTKEPLPGDVNISAEYERIKENLTCEKTNL